MVPLALDLPGDSRRPEDQWFVGAEHAKPLVGRLDAHGRLPELGPGRETNMHWDIAADDPGEVGAADRDIVGQIVGDLESRPPGADRHGAVDVALAERQGCRLARLDGRPDRELAGLVGAQEAAEQCGGVGFGVAHPADLGVGRDEGDGAR